jgi:hypothetical protein
MEDGEDCSQESDPKLLDLRSVLAEVQRLREENIRLRCLLQEHGIHISAAQSTTGIPVTTSALPSAHISVLKAEQRNRIVPEPLPRARRCLCSSLGEHRRAIWVHAQGRS